MQLRMSGRLLGFVAFIFITPIANALDSVSLNIGTLTGAQWQLDDINIALTDLAQSPQQLALTISRLSLPPPFNDLSLVNIRCTAFTWQNKELSCEQGRAKLHSKRWQSPSTQFSFHITEQHSSFKLSDLPLAGGIIAIEGEERGEQWQVQLDAQAVEGKLIQQLLPPQPFKLKAGKANIALKASGSHARLDALTLTAVFNGLTGQSQDGRIAAEALLSTVTLNAQNNNGLWHWQNHVEINGGVLYVEPLYLETAGHSLIWEAQGDWNPANAHVDIKSAHYRHSTVGELSGSASVKYKDGVSLEQAELSLNTNNLQGLSEIYLKPFVEQTVLQGVSFAGRLKADVSVSRHSLTALTATFDHVDIKDAAGRGGILGGAGRFNWSNDETFLRSSKLAWRHLQLRAVPIGPAELSFLTRADRFRLLKKAELPFSGGIFAINHFNWQAKKQLSFEGDLSNVSLEQLSTALNWTPLSGSLSGHIPRVDYSDKTLSLGGELVVKVFDGEVRISNLACSGLFTDFPKLQGDLDIDNLDLDQLTGKFKFGGITGRLSGYVRQLSMENWRPLTFFAWLGTPENDDSRHRISQKAVQNIANIGGGGAADLLSKSFLRFFETFGYDKLGLGCYLHDGVCQLMGVEATESGYAIITGGGLPRINVIGYNPRVDWNVLMERLQRISTSDDVIVE